MVLGKLSVPWRLTNLNNRRSRDYCACNRCGWGCLDIFSLLSPSLGDSPIYTDILSQRADNSINNHQPTLH